MRIPLLRRRLPSLFNAYWDRVRDHHTIEPIVNFPASARAQWLPPTFSSVHIVLRETVTWFPSSSFVVTNLINLGPRGIVLPLFYSCTTVLLHEMRAKPPQCQFCDSPPTLARRYQSFCSRRCGPTSSLVHYAL